MRKNNYLKNHFSAFTLAEMMVVMLIMSIILAAMAPVMTTKNKTDNSSPWRYSPQNSSDAYFGAGQSMRALVGQVNGTENDNGKLVINTLNNSSISHILFKSGADNVLGDLFFNGTSLVLGNRRNTALTIGNENINIGHDNWSDTSNLTGSSNITIGDASMQSLTSGSHNIGIGTSLSAVSTGDSNIALGDNTLTSTTGNGNIAIGGEANQNSNTNATIAIGRYSSATGENSIAIGSNTENNNGNAAQATAEKAIAIGNASIASVSNAIALGVNSQATADSATAIGYETVASAGKSAALGFRPKASGEYSTAIGVYSKASGEHSTVVGWISEASANGATAIGCSNSASGALSTAIGNRNTVNDASSVAIGDSNDVNESDSVAIGMGNTVSGYHSVALGLLNKASEQGTIAIGSQSSAKETFAIALGADAAARGHGSIAIGYEAKAAGRRNVAIGYESCKYVTGSNKTCIGANSGPASGTAWATDSTERIFIGGKSNFNGGPAVLEVHNSKNQLRVDNNFGMTETAVVVNGNLIVKGTIIGRGAYAGGSGGENFAGYDNRTYAIGTSGDKGLRKGNVPETEMFQNFNSNGAFGRGDMTYSSSDRRLKYVGKENKSGLDKIRQLKVFDYVYKKDTAKTPHVGVIAQDLQKVFPNAVKKGADGFLTIRMEDMFFAVINAIKELDSRVTKLEKENKELKARLDKLEAKVK